MEDHIVPAQHDHEASPSSLPCPCSSPATWVGQCQKLMQDSAYYDANINQCFFKVLPNMRHAPDKISDFDPLFFTFGPYHAKLKLPLSSCDRYKVLFAKALIPDRESFQCLQSAIQNRDRDIRSIYGELRADGRLVDEIDRCTLALLLAFDALTLIAGVTIEGKSDLVKPPILRSVIWRDAMLLEQQLPLFILEAAINIINLPTCTLKTVVSFYTVRTSYPFRSNVEVWKWQEPSKLEQSMLSHIHHTLVTVASRSEQICTGQQCQETPVIDDFVKISTASKLKQCGIHFRAGDGGFTGISFCKETRVVTLPEITVFDDTKAYLRNLAAHEAGILAECEHDRNCSVTSYILLMDSLIDSEEDVKLLVERKVINNQLGSDAQLAQMWNTLAVNLPISYTASDSKTIKDVREASRNRLCKCWAGFHDTYFVRKPWLMISILAAAALLIMALLQTIYTRQQLHHNRR